MGRLHIFFDAFDCLDRSWCGIAAAAAAALFLSASACAAQQRHAPAPEFSSGAVSATKTADEKQPMKSSTAQAGFAVPRQWLNSRVTLAEVEGPARAADLVRPADSQAWRAFKGRIGPQDELWYFTSPPGSFTSGSGKTGYVIMRNGEQVSSFVALMN